MEFPNIVEKTNRLVQSIKDAPQWLNDRALSILNNELSALGSEPWIAHDDQLYVQKVHASLLEGKYDDLLKTTLKDTAVCFMLNNVPLAFTLTGSIYKSIESGQEFFSAVTQAVGVTLTTLALGQIPAAGYLFFRHFPNSPKDAAAKSAIIAPSLIPVSLPGYTTIVNSLGSLALQNPEEFWKILKLEVVSIPHRLKRTLQGVAGKAIEQYKGII